jgi:hypothetical protein
LLAVSICTALPSSFAPAVAAQQPAPHGDRVDGGNLTRVDFDGGRYEQEDGYWAEYGRDGRVRFQFEETGRDEWSVYLIDRSRNVAIQLDLFRHMVTYAVNGGSRSDLYPILDAAASPKADDFQGAAPPQHARSTRDAGGSMSTVMGGFYRQQSRPEVVFQFGETLHCVVQNPSQMSAYGGFNRVRVVPRLAMRGNSTGACGWPNGFYHRATDPAVYRLYGSGPLRLGRGSCHVVNPPQMERFGGFRLVVEVEQSSDLFRGREQPTECPDS